MRPESSLFPALLKYWRSRRGRSQLDLALDAGVSARHLSFLENGRAQPSREMILRLATTLSLPMRDQNALLAAAGQPAAYAEPGLDAGLSGPIRAVIDRMLAQQEPFPMVVMNRRYDVLQLNRGATALMTRLVADPAAAPLASNLFRLLFDPRLARPFVVDWDRVARILLGRLHREVLERPQDEAMAALLRSLFDYPEVPRDWQQPDLAEASEPFVKFQLRRGELDLAFLSTVTVFSAPQNVTLEELRLEAFFPLDDATRRACEALAR